MIFFFLIYVFDQKYCSNRRLYCWFLVANFVDYSVLRAGHFFNFLVFFLLPSSFRSTWLIESLCVYCKSLSLETDRIEFILPTSLFRHRFPYRLFGHGIFPVDRSLYYFRKIDCFVFVSNLQSTARPCFRFVAIS